jgi:hypothetical protein
MHQTDFHLWTYKVSLKRVLISVASFIGIPNSVTVFYNTSFITET